MMKYLLLFFLTSNFALFGCKAEQNIIKSSPKMETVQNIAPDQWQKVGEGLDYKDVQIEISSKGAQPQLRPLNLLLVRIDPKKFLFKIYQNQNKTGQKTIKEIHESAGSLLTFNGSFFDENFRPAGLLVSMGKKLNSFSRAKLMNGIFTIKEDGKAKLYYPARDISANGSYFAIQNGPVLIRQDGKFAIHSESDAVASRTAIGLDKNGNVIIIVIKQSLFNSENAITLYRFARLLKESPELKSMELNSVLNLDGGSSTGMVINDRYLPELNPVQNVITVFKKHENSR